MDNEVTRETLHPAAVCKGSPRSSTHKRLSYVKTTAFCSICSKIRSEPLTAKAQQRGLTTRYMLHVWTLWLNECCGCAESWSWTNWNWQQLSERMPTSEKEGRNRLEGARRCLGVRSDITRRVYFFCSPVCFGTCTRLAAVDSVTSSAGSVGWAACSLKSLLWSNHCLISFQCYDVYFIYFERLTHIYYFAPTGTKLQYITFTTFILF